MRHKRFQTQPRVEGLESMTLLSGAAAALTAAAPAVVAPLPPAPHPITLTGTAHGNYVSRQSNPDTGTNYSILAHGKITPLGQTFISGSFTTPGFIQNAHAQGTLTLRDARGTLTLKIVGVTPTTTTSATMHPEFDFTYTITHGTGKFRNAQGTGALSVVLNTTNSVGSSGHHLSVGRVTVSISPVATPLA